LYDIASLLAIDISTVLVLSYRENESAGVANFSLLTIPIVYIQLKKKLLAPSGLQEFPYDLVYELVVVVV
jgi:hypothetical protein